MHRRAVLLLALLFAPATPRVAHAAWPVTGYPLCNVPEDLQVPVARAEFVCIPFGGCGGVLTLYWQDGRLANGSIYQASVNDAAPPDPPAVNPATLFLQRPGIQTPGGVVRVTTKCNGSQFCQPIATMFAWTDAPDGAPSMVRVRRDGGIEIPDWGPDGVVVATSDGSQHDASLIHDLQGGAIVIWLDETPDHRLVYAQRLDSLHNRLWGEAGVLVGSDTTVQTVPLLAPDGSGGAYVLREDLRGAVRTLALFRLAPDGTIVTGWPAAGVVLGTAPLESPGPMLRVGTSGAWVVWSELATLSDDISTGVRPFVSFVGLSGEVSQVFTAAGTPITSSLDGDAVVDDATVGIGDDVIVAYEYTQLLPGPSPSSTDLFATRIDAQGSHPAGWPASGLLVCGAPGVQRQGRLVTTGYGYYGGRVFVAWTDERSGDGDIYAKELRNDGTLPTEWPVNGLPVCGVAGTQQDPVIAPNAVGGAFVAWRDGRDAITNNWDLYAQTVSGDARLDVPPVVVTKLALLAPRPNPARGPVRFTLELPASGSVRVDIHDVAGRRLRRETIAADRGARELVWDLANDAGTRVSPGLYIVRVRAAGEERTARVLVAR
jgi:hypothetical protein